MTNEQLINEAIAILQMSNMEDCAAAVQTLQSELERVKRIAADRLDTIQNLRHDVAVLEDKLEDTRSDVRAIEEATAQLRRSAANALLR
jgi:Skp family chaperone for outer membrane proteins